MKEFEVQVTRTVEHYETTTVHVTARDSEHAIQSAEALVAKEARRLFKLSGEVVHDDFEVVD